MPPMPRLMGEWDEWTEEAPPDWEAPLAFGGMHLKLEPHG